MTVPFNNLPDSARIWIYQTDRVLTDTETKLIRERVSGFLEKWTAHGSTLHAGVDILYNHFIVIGLDESLSGASGCSIDSLFRDLSALSQMLKVDFFNRELIAFLINNEVRLIPRVGLKAFFQEADASVLTFNNLVSTKRSLQSEWLLPAETSWLKRYIPSASV